MPEPPPQTSTHPADDHNDLTSQVTVLSTRLIEAIDRQADLEDQVQVLRRELDNTRRKNMTFEDQVRSGLLVSQKEYIEQVRLRNVAERESDRLKGEIEELTSSLFDEANKMVATANRETSVWGRKNEQLLQQLKERDVLLDDLQEQLAALKMVLEDVSDERDKLQKITSFRTSFINQSLETFHDAVEDGATGSEDQTDANSTNLASNTSSVANPSATPAAATAHNQPEELYHGSFNSLWRPVLRHDLQNFHDFCLMAPNPQTANHPTNINPTDSSIVSGRSSPASQLNADTTTGSTESATQSSSLNITSITSRFHSLSNSDSSSSTANGHAATSSTTTTSSSSSSSLKDFKFFKSSIVDDIEPTLRLDLAPSLNWLSRRNIMSSIYDGSIKIEPIAVINEGYKLVFCSEPYGPGASPTSPIVTSTRSNSIVESEEIHAPVPTPASQQLPQTSVQTQVPSNQYVTPFSLCVGSTMGQKVYASLSSVPPGQSPPIATLAPCAFCGEKRTASLLYARLHNLRSEKDKEKNSRSKEGSGARDGDSVTAHLAHMSMFSALSMPNVSNMAKERERAKLSAMGISYKESESVMTTTTTTTTSTTTTYGHSRSDSADTTSDVRSIETSDPRESYIPLTPTVSGSTTIASTTSGATATTSTSSGYPLCHHCLNRVRSVCDYISFIRALRMGVWRTDDETSRYKAWEECVRLKECMFWARQGGSFLKTDEGNEPVKLDVSMRQLQQNQLQQATRRRTLITSLQRNGELSRRSSTSKVPTVGDLKNNRDSFASNLEENAGDKVDGVPEEMSEIPELPTAPQNSSSPKIEPVEKPLANSDDDDGSDIEVTEVSHASIDLTSR